MNANQSSTILLPDLEEPIRAELFSLERLEQHAESLAAAQAVTSEASRGRPLIPRVMDNGRVLLDSYRVDRPRDSGRACDYACGRMAGR